MKKHIYKMKVMFSCVLLASCLLLTACDDWLDVKPKTQIESDDMFSSETGFKDVLNGVYVNLSSSDMYGREMTYGLVDIIGDTYYGVYGNTNYSRALSHEYTFTGVEEIINTIWKKSYTTIAMLNELLNQLEQADKSMFGTDNYNVIKGEALGLRAFLHFDILRLFAQSPAANANAPAIPYVTEYTFRITPSSTVNETLEKVIADLQTAADLLKQSDPIATGREITTTDDSGYLLNRQYHMNYYAVKAMMARAYLYKGDMGNARQCAQEVIGSGKFSWTKVDYIATTQESDRDRTFTSEQVFALQIDNLDSYVIPSVYSSATSALVRLYINSNWLDKAWPAATHSTDWRRVYFMTNTGTNSPSNYTSSKLWQEGMNENYVKRMPLIRLPEMYLILAECDVSAAATWLNVIREHRGVTAMVEATEADALQDEITLEYFREFFNEGQMFYHYKRMNADMHFKGYSFNKSAYNTGDYVLPMPAEEIEFGNRTTK